MENRPRARLARIQAQLSGEASQNVNECAASASFFVKCTAAPLDPILGLKVLYNKDSSPNKVDLGIGAYRTDEGKPYVLNCVKRAEAMILQDKSLNKEYLAQRGDPTFCKLARDLLFGASAPAKENRIATAQSLSGTGALRIASDFIARFIPNTTVYYSDPTWGNHLTICKDSKVATKPYRYWDAKNRKLDLHGMIEDLKNAPDGSIILLHACAHNPTGVDPTPDQWKQIAQVMKSKNHLPWLDSAYQGFASGSLETDAFAIRLFAEMGFEMLVCQSFAKNFGLYGERAGTVSIVTDDPKKVDDIMSQLDLIIRGNYSNPPLHGARIVATVLKNGDLTKEWHEELLIMSGRIKAMRKALFDRLVKLGTPGDWSHITSQIGMFSFLGISPSQVKVLIEKHHIYLLSSGRISMAGVTTKNVDHVAQALHDVVVNVK